MIYRLQSGNDDAVCEEHDTADCSLEAEETSPGSGKTVLPNTHTEKAPSGIIKTISFIDMGIYVCNIFEIAYVTYLTRIINPLFRHCPRTRYTKHYSGDNSANSRPRRYIYIIKTISYRHGYTCLSYNKFKVAYVRHLTKII